VKLELVLDGERVAPGGEVTGHVLVREGGEARSLGLRVAFVERSPGFRVAAFEQRAVLREGDLATGDTIPVRVGLPDTAPPTVKGRRCELLWEIEAIADRSGPDAAVRQTFEVALDA
jgi:hypothetical protein